MAKFIKVGPLVLNEERIESVGLEVEVRGQKVTLIRMARGHRQRTEDGERDVVVTYTFVGKAAEAVKLYFGGEMPLYPGYNGWLMDLAKGYSNWERLQREEKFAQVEEEVREMMPAPPLNDRPSRGVKLDVMKIREKLSPAAKN